MHFSKVAVIRCADDNYSPGFSLTKGFQKILNQEMATIHFLPGGGFGSSLEFTKPECQKLWKWRIGVAQSLGIEKILLIDHMTPHCGAFEYEFGKMTTDEEKEQHLETIKIAREFFCDNSGFEFVAYLQTGEETYEKIY